MTKVMFSLCLSTGGAGYLSHNALQNLPTMWPRTSPPHRPTPYPPQEVGTVPPAPYHHPHPVPPPAPYPRTFFFQNFRTWPGRGRGRYASCGHAGGLSCCLVKLTCFLSRFRSEWELYDLKADSHQLHNLAGDPTQNATLTKLKQQLMNWRKMTGDYWVCYPEDVLLGGHCGATYNET